MHLYLTLKLLAPICYVSVAGIKYQNMTQKGVTMDHINPYDLHQNHSTHPTTYRLVKRGSQTACNRKNGCHDSCTLCKG
jgi:hypothetical protein